MPHKITAVNGELVDVDPPVKGRAQLKREKFGVTDPALALLAGTEFEQGIPTNYITKFEPNLAKEIGKSEPTVDTNPFNFVAFAAPRPWLFAAGASKDDPNEQWGHDTLKGYSGTIQFTATTRTPCFIPEGFPFQDSDVARPDMLRQIDRRFFRLRDSNDASRYAIPGASFKGALRAAVEAISNSRLGVMDDKIFDRFAHLYRRRVFRVGRLASPLPNGGWNVQELRPNLDGGGSIRTDNLQGLLAALARNKNPNRYLNPGSDTFTLPAELAAQYVANADHPHFERHWLNEQENAAKRQPEHFYAKSFNKNNYNAEIKTLNQNDVIYFSVDGRKIVNFGKNMNYLWPAQKSLRDLAGPFAPRGDAAKLDQYTDMAEYLFGFNGKHDKEKETHPFQGHLKFETLWGPEVDDHKCIRLQLAALTSPASKGKSRPLYLDRPDDGVSASFDDINVRLRGRKFYWAQRSNDGASIWVKHTNQQPIDRDLRKKLESQCPPPILALGKDTTFSGRIHFSNLNAQAIGAILFALQGDGTFAHVFHVGKGKPRGLGNFEIKVQSLLIDRNPGLYDSLTASEAIDNQTEKIPAVIRVFAAWCAIKAGQDPKTTPLAKHPHIADYIKLHTWPDKNSVRNYPINFNQYSWLPADNDAAGEPRSPANRNPSRSNRPPSMRRARDLNP